jgi:hemophore-related protein
MIVGSLVAGIAATATISGSVAGADPVDGPLINSTCSYEQIDRALRVERPDVAAKIDSDPMRKAGMQLFFSRPVPERRALVQQYLNANPGGMTRLQEWEDQHPQQVRQGRALADKVAATCHNY